MISARVYDPARNPAHWTGLIARGQYAVFVHDARGHLAHDPDGSRPLTEDAASIAICDDLAEATAFSRDLVGRHPGLCCEIYDHEGKAGQPVEVIYHPRIRGKYQGLQFARREAFWGGLAVCGGAAFIAVDALRGLEWIWGYVIGAKLVIIGGAVMVRGLAGCWQHRAEAGPARAPGLVGEP